MSVGNLHMLLASTAYASVYSLESSTASISEGSGFSITVNSLVPDGTTVGYTITGVQSTDIDQSTTGTLTLTSGTSTLPITTTINDDQEMFLAGEPTSSLNYDIFRRQSNINMLGSSIFQTYLYPRDRSQRASSLFVKPGGEKFWMLDNNNEEIAEFTMTPEPNVDQYSLNTVVPGPVASYGTLGTNHQGLWISSSGTQLFQTDRDLKRIIQDTISAWNPTASLGPQSPERTLDISANANLPAGIHVKPDGTKAFIVDVSNPTLGNPGAILEYSGTAFQCNTWTFSTSLAVNYFPLDLWVSDDGAVMYTVADNSSVVRYYTLSTPWNLSTASLVTSSSISGYDRFQGIAVARPASETFRLTLDAADSLGNPTGSKFVDVVISG